MRTMCLSIAAALLALTASGCQALGPVADPTPLAVPGAPVPDGNPFYLPHGNDFYGPLFETIIQVLGDYQFEIANGDTNRYDGRIETVPRVAPGLGLLLKPGSPSLYERLLATFQSYRHRVTVVILPADQGGYWVEVIARRELQDLPVPVRSTVGSSLFRNNNVDRSYEVIDASFFEAGWIFRGRDAALEQELIRRIKRSL